VNDEQHIQPEPGPSHRHASVKLSGHGGEGGQEGPRLDPANQSLAEALGVVFKLIQVCMVGLVAYFLLSGFKSIQENQTGIRLVFGRPVGGGLPPGFQFSYPFPVGDMLKVDTGERTLEIKTSFWQQLSRPQEGMTIEQLAQSESKYFLNPAVDGSLITGDQALAHTQCRVRFSRQNAVEFVGNVAEDQEEAIVRAAVERGIVQAVAQVTIEDFLKQGPDDQGFVARTAQRIAQESLDQIGSGLAIHQLTLQVRTPPLFVLMDFNRVQSAEQQSGQALRQAEATARDTLSAMAGGAADVLVEQIDRYEEALAKDDAQAQEVVLRRIYALLDGQNVEIDGRTLTDPVAGKVTAILNEAKQYRSTIVAQRRAELQNYNAKLALFKTNPDVVIQRDWADALSVLMSRDTVEKFLFPPGVRTVSLPINRDIEAQKLYDSARKQKKNEEDQRQREREASERRFKTDTNVQAIPAG
jgi:regulator of protease activity HflC (stomatin/prohibitin superfamily)